MEKQNKIFTTFFHRIVIATGILLFTIFYFMETNSLQNPQDKLLINPVILIMVLLYPIIIWQEWREHKKEQKEVKDESELSEEGESDDESSAKLTRKVFLFMLLTLLYLLVIEYVGFIITTVIYMPVLMYVLGTKSKKILITLPVIFTILLYLLFNNMLGIPLPLGFFDI